MKLEKHHSLKRADTILAILMENNDSGNIVTVECFSNCREQGYTLTNTKTGKCVVFCENRNSDCTRVYYGHTNEFDVSTNHPTNWDNCKYFEWNEYIKTVMFIEEYLTS